MNEGYEPIKEEAIESRVHDYVINMSSDRKNFSIEDFNHMMETLHLSRDEVHSSQVLTDFFYYCSSNKHRYFEPNKIEISDLDIA